MSADIFAVWNDVDSRHEIEYYRWYWLQHLPARLSVPGFSQRVPLYGGCSPQKFFIWYYVRIAVGRTRVGPKRQLVSA